MDTYDRQLRYFQRIAQLGSLSRAAEELDQTQSGLSRQLAALEGYVGKPLFNRTGRGVELTAAGLQLQEQTSGAFDVIDKTLDNLRVREGITQGTVRLAVVHTLSYYFMSDVVSRFVSQHESVNLSLMGRSSPDVVDLVESGKADAGFVYDAAVASSGLTCRPLFDDDMCLIVPDGSTLEGPVDLTAQSPRLVGFPSHYVLRRMVHSAGITPHFAAEAETVDAMLKLVSSGVGLCILPCRIPEKLLVDYRLRKVPIARPMLRRRVVVIVKADKTLPPIVERLIETAMDIAASI